MFLLRAALLLGVLVVVSGDEGFSPRMPLHRTQGVFDLITPRMMLKVIGKLFKGPLKFIKHFIKPFSQYARTMWTWVGHGDALPGVTPITARMIQETLDSITPETIEDFFDALGV